jgi:hypothetical protein
MMGSKERDFARRINVSNVSVEELVPPGHLYRPLDCVLDLSFVRDLVEDC